MTPTLDPGSAPADLREHLLVLAGDLRTLQAEVRELKAQKPTAWLTPEGLAARLHPRRSPKWWRNACRLGLVPDAVKHADSRQWLVPAATAERLGRDGLPALPRRVYATARDVRDVRDVREAA